MSGQHSRQTAVHGSTAQHGPHRVSDRDLDSDLAAQPAGALRPLYFVRHGASEPNLAGLRCGGDLNVALTDLGREQALGSAQRLQAQGLHIGLVVSSGLLRTDETAAIIARQLGAVPVITLPGFVERHLGQWNRRSISESEPWIAGGLTPPGGESNDEFLQRIQQAVTALLPHWPAAPGRPLVVASRGVARALGELTGRPGTTPLANGQLDHFDLSACASVELAGSLA